MRRSRTLLPALLSISLAFIATAAAAQQVQVTSAVPSEAPQGTLSLDVTVSGSGFDSSAAVEFLVTGTADPGGIIVRKVKVTGSKKLVATIDVADTAVIDKFDIQVSLSGGRKGKGTSLFAVLAKVNGDPCAAPGIDFPAFSYWKQSGSTQQLYLADASGACSRPLYLVTDSTGGGSSSQMSYPVDGFTNRGRIVWKEGLDVVAGDFTISGTNVTLQPPRVIFSPARCCALAMTHDGRHIYVSTNSNTLERIQVSDTSIRSLVRTLPDDGSMSEPSINGDETALYLRERRQFGSDGTARSELIRIDLMTSQATVLVSKPETSFFFWPAADPDSNRIVYTDYLPGSNNCYLLQIADGTTGATISYGQPRYGRDSTWRNGKILTVGYKPPNRQNRCLSMDSITEIDPFSSAERIVIINGHSPDGS